MMSFCVENKVEVLGAVTALIQNSHICKCLKF